MIKRSDIMLAMPFEERRLTNSKFGWRWPVIVQPKLDGERCRIVSEKGKIKLLSSTCHEIISVPHINKQIKDMKLINMPELDGELYVHGWDLSDIHSVVSRKSEETIHDKSELMEFHCFDFISEMSQVERYLELFMSDLSNNISIKRVPHKLACNLEELFIIYNDYLSLGYEGIIIRHINAPYIKKRSRFMMKFKPKKEDYYLIVGVKEAFSQSGQPLSMLGAFTCSGFDGNIFPIGAGCLSHEERKQIWKDRSFLPGKFCRAQYQNITKKGIPRFGLCINVVDENPEEELPIEGIL